MSHRIFTRLCLLAAILAFVVVVLGAYVRLSSAGLGCPDWPGCYGHLSVPSPEKAQASHPDSPLVAHKAWKEMIHRYVAGTLALLILALAILSIPLRKEIRFSPFLPWLLVALVVFQALLGRWTVTLKLHPVVVMAHLLGGFSTLGLLGWMTLRNRDLPHPASPYKGEEKKGTPLLCKEGRGEVDLVDFRIRPWVIAGLLLLLIQISLGGWMSSNYASLACPDFPTCQGHWWPPMDFHGAFLPSTEIGPNYEGGKLDNPARVTIHMMHRLGAALVFVYLLALSLFVIKTQKGTKTRTFAKILIFFLVLQVLLGISNILLHLPLGIATAHNAVAALLFLSLLGVIATQQ